MTMISKHVTEHSGTLKAVWYTIKHLNAEAQL